MAAKHDFGNRPKLFASGTARGRDLHGEAVHAHEFAAIDAHEMRMREPGFVASFPKLKAPDLNTQVKAIHKPGVRQLVQTTKDR